MVNYTALVDQAQALIEKMKRIDASVFQQHYAQTESKIPGAEYFEYIVVLGNNEFDVHFPLV